MSSDNFKTIITLIVAIPSLASTYFMWQDREAERTAKEAEMAAKEAKEDTIQLFINKQNQQNEKLAIFFATLDSTNKLSVAITDSTEGR